MSILAKSGAMDRDTFHKIEITDNRIKSYLHAGLIKETSVVDKNGNGIRTYFELGNKGKDFCRQECHTNSSMSFSWLCNTICSGTFSYSFHLH